MKTISTFFISCLLFVGMIQAQPTPYRWTMTGGSDVADFGEGICTDDQGNAYVTGFVRGAASIFGTDHTPAGTTNYMFLAKLSPNKELLWYVTAEASGSTGASGFKTTYSNGYVYLLGDFRGDAVFHSTDLTTTPMTSENRANFIARYSDAGVLDWVRKFETSNTGGLITTGSANNLVADSQGNVYFTTQFRTDINMAGTLLEPTTGGTNFYALVVKLDALGAYQWHWNSVNAGDDRGEAIGLAPNGNVVFVTRFNTAITINGTTTENSTGGLAIIELKPDGTHVRNHVIKTGSTNQANIFGLDHDASGNLYLGGHFRTPLTWSESLTIAPTATGNTGSFIFKLNSDWEIIWTRLFGNPAANDVLRALKLAPSGNIFVAGDFNGTAVFSDNLSLESAGNADGYFASFSPDGTVLEASRFGGSSLDATWGLDVGPNNEVYIVGRYQNVLLSFGEEFENRGSFDLFVIHLGGKNTDATLSSITVGGTAVAGFDPAVLEYTIDLPTVPATMPVVAATANDPKATVSVVQADAPTTTDRLKSAIITVKAENQTITSEYKVTFRLTTSLTEPGMATLRVYPNPARDVLYLEGFAESGSIRMFDLTGRTVFFADNVSGSLSIPLTGFEKGMYVLRLQDKQGRTTQVKIAVQ